MWLLYLKICTIVTVFGVQNKECIVVTPASYATYGLCMSAGLDFVAAQTSSEEGKTATWICRRQLRN